MVSSACHVSPFHRILRKFIIRKASKALDEDGTQLVFSTTSIQAAIAAFLTNHVTCVCAVRSNHRRPQWTFPDATLRGSQDD